MRREERVTVQGPLKEQQPDGMSHRGSGIGLALRTGLGQSCDGVQNRVWVGIGHRDQAEVWGHGQGTRFMMCFGRG